MTALDLASALTVRDQRKHSRPPAQLFLARVVSAAGSYVTVAITDDLTAEPVTVPRMRAYSSPAVNDVVILAKSGQSLYCLGALNGAPVPPPNPEDEGPELPSGGGTSGGEMSPTPPAVPVSQTRSFRPVFTGTYRAGAWRTDTSDLYQGTGTVQGAEYGAAYYGGAPAALGTVEAMSGTVRVQRLRAMTGVAVSPRLRLLTDSERPEGFPSFTEELDGPPLSIDEAAEIQLPLSWVAALLDGSAGGIGIGGEVFVRLAGPASWAPGMQLTLSYRKVL